MSAPVVAAKVLQEWKDFDLEGKRNALDGQAATITEVREESMASRKKLAGTTRDFKKLPAEEKMRGVGPLLKVYQQEIDKLTQRCKGAESAFLGLYTSLQAVSDPCIGLTSAIDESQKLSAAGKFELENKNLRSQLEEYQEEFRDIKNQEVTIRILEDRIKEFEVRMDSMVQEKIEETSETLKQDTATTISQLKEREENLMHQLEQTKGELSRTAAQNATLQGEVLAEKTYFTEKLEAKQDELEYMAEEINRMTSENERMKRDLGRARKEVDDMASGVANEKHVQQISNLEEKIAQRDLELAEAREQLVQVKDALEMERSSQGQVLLQVQNELLEEREMRGQLEATLAEAPSREKYEKLRRKVEILKGIEGLTSTHGEGQDDSVESLLQQKNRRLETQVLQTKEALEVAERRVEALQVEVANLIEKNTQQRELVQKLEEDVLQGYNPAGAPEEAGTAGAPRADSMLKIVCSQRDRVQAQLQKMEASKDELQHQVESLHGEATSLRSDNVKLYQKIQYLQSYNAKRRPDNTGAARDLESGVVETKYKTMYEESVNPFSEFNRKERTSRYKQLNAAERVTLTMGDFFLSNKYSRLFILIYTVVLHLFIFALMYKFAGMPTHCPQN